MSALLWAWGVALALCVNAAVVYAVLRLLAWPLLAWARRRLRRRVLAYDATVQHQLALDGDPRGTHGRYPPHC